MLTKLWPRLLLGISCLGGVGVLGPIALADLSGAATGWDMARSALTRSALAQTPDPQATSPQIQVTTTPDLAAASPNGTPIQFQIQTLGADQTPLTPVRYQIQLQTPPATPWFSSDFPHTEASVLLELGSVEADGVLEFAQVLPIRGAYTLQVSASLDQLNPPLTLSQPVTLRLPERSVRYRNAALWALALLAIGLGGGWIIGGNPTVQPGEVAPQRVRFLLSGATVAAIAALLYVNIRAELGLIPASGAGHGHAHAPAPVAAQSAGAGGDVAAVGPGAAIGSAVAADTLAPLQVTFTSSPSATIGAPAAQAITVTDGVTGDPVAAVPVVLEIRDQEHDRPVFSYTPTTDDRGQIHWRSQFFDAADHQIVATPLGTNAPTRQFMEITALKPPLSVRLISLGYLMAFFGVGLGAGYGLHRFVGDRPRSLYS